MIRRAIAGVGIFAAVAGGVLVGGQSLSSNQADAVTVSAAGTFAGASTSFRMCKYEYLFRGQPTRTGWIRCR